MVTIKYCKEGTAVSDYALKDFGQLVQAKTNKDADVVFEVSSSIAILYIRTLVSKKEINHNQIRFLFGDTYIEMNKYGSLLKDVEGFADTFDNLLDILLGLK